MKFLCDQCKAKYQIADDKVVGKTVRMKCRKCGHMIEVKAEVTESSVATKLPVETSAPAASPAAPLAGQKASTTAPRAPMAPSAPRAGVAPAAPKPAATAPSAPKSALATSLASARPPAQSRSEGPLASAFQKSVQKDDDAALLELSSSAEWYVAINGVPVGPIRVGELKRKAAGGGITEDSLCWQEGMEEWRPVRSVTELAALLREVAAAGRPSLVTPPPQDVRPSAPPAAAKPAAQAPRSPQQPAGRTDSTKPLAPAARSNVVAINSRLATAEKLEDEEDERTMVGDPFAFPPPAAKPGVANPLFVADPFAAPAPAAGAPAPTSAASPFAPPSAMPVAAASASSDLGAPPVVQQQQQKQPPWIAVGMLVLFAAFGVTAAVMIFSRPPAQPQPVASAVAPTVAAPVLSATVQPTATVAAVDTAPVPSASASAAPDKPLVATNSGGSGKPAASSTGKVVDPSIAALLGNDHGPVGPGAGGGGGGGGGGGSALSGDAIEGVVRAHSTSVKRQCWEKGGGTAADVSVRVHLTIGGNGQVQSASANGNDPAIAKCIEGQVQRWVFPASGGITDVDIPFHFLRQ